jgi:putative ribosome biogenesis GTPase RsgA
VRAAVRAGAIDAERYDSYHRLATGEAAPEDSAPPIAPN